MDRLELEDKLVDAILNMEERKILKEKEENMLNSKEVNELILSFQKALDDYNFALKSLGENSPITKDFQKKLHYHKYHLDIHPLVKEYNDYLIKCNEPLHYLENNLISLFKRRGDHRC